MRLNEIADKKAARKARIRVGRGPGSGKGTRAGRGDKGQKSRSGVAIKGFEGGQMPIYRRLPKRGFKSPFKKEFNEVNLSRLQEAVDAKKLDPKKPVTVEALLEAGVIRRPLDGVRILGNGELKTKLALEVSGASKSAMAAVEKAGGSVTIVARSPAAKDNSDKGEKKPAKSENGEGEPQDDA